MLVQDSRNPFQAIWSVGEHRVAQPSLPAQQQAIIGRPELTISSVCRHWRKLAIHDPLLWNHINFRNEHIPFIRSQAYLGRSKGATIVAEARVGNAPRGTEVEIDAYFNEAFTTLFPYVRQ
ncbi:hypothetical protein FS837_003357, partial [Tulasnella sp. UAMH 9824]